MPGIVHVITDLGAGGAEGALVRLLGAVDRSAFPSEVVSLRSRGVHAEALERLGVEVTTLDLRASTLPSGIARLARRIQGRPGCVVHCWMPHAQLVGSLAAVAARESAVTWSVRRTLSGLWEPMALRIVQDLVNRLATRVPVRIVYNGEAARREHEAVGHPPERGVVIPNGFDLDRFRPDPAARRALRAELGLAEDVELIGQVGRVHAQKDLPTLAAAVARVVRDRPRARLLLAGAGATLESRQLVDLLARERVLDRTHLLGHRPDVQRVLAALDVAVLASCGLEAVPNVVGEALACGVPCAVTDVGDAARLVGDCGRVVPPGDPRALARAVLELLAAGAEARRRLGERARRRMASGWSMDAFARRHEEVWREAAGQA